MHLEFVTPNDPLTSIVLKNPNVNTLERLTQDFLATLQTGGFPSTTGTILRLVHFIHLCFILLYCTWMWLITK